MNKILIVDDDRSLALALRLRLTAMGFSARTCASAEEATPLVLRWRPDAIILDIDMPSYTGLEFHECLRFSAVGRDIPVIYLSGHDSSVYRRVALEQGARAFIIKPYNAEQLARTLDSVIASCAVAK